MLTAAAVVVCALDLLGRSAQSTVPIRFLETAPPGASTNVEAFVTSNPDTIYLITSTEAFRDARGRNGAAALDGCRKIASIIVHEEWHLRYGGDEEGAYLAQMMALRLLRAPTSLISSVHRSMTAVLAARKNRTKPELVLSHAGR